jgi:hypothetical protein
MHAVAGDELAEMQAELVVGIGRDVMKLIYGDQPSVKRFNAILIDGESERGVRAYQHPVIAVEKRRDGLDLTAVIRTRGVAEVPFRLHAPIGPKAILGKRLVIEARPD